MLYISICHNAYESRKLQGRNMNDIKTQDIVSYILNRLGYQLVSKDAFNNPTDLDLYINFIKLKVHKISNPQLVEFITYFL